MKTSRQIILEKIIFAQGLVNVAWFDDIDISAIDLSITDPVVYDFSELNNVNLQDAILFLLTALDQISVSQDDYKKLCFFIYVLKLSSRIIELSSAVPIDLNLGVADNNRALSRVLIDVQLFRDGRNESYVNLSIDNSRVTEKFLGLQIDRLGTFTNLDMFLLSENDFPLLLYTLDLLTLESLDSKILLSSPASMSDKNFFYYSYVLSGGSFINSTLISKTYTAPFGQLIPKYKNSIDYKQFYEVLGVLEDGNHETFVLDRYLKLYQVMENFTFRLPITNFVNTAPSSNRFTVRKFRSLYKAVDKADGVSLGQFILRFIEEIPETPGARSNFLVKLQSEVTRNFTDSELEEICAFLGKDFARNKADLIRKIGNKDEISNVIYFIRNSIVHNKETEVHISNSMIQNNCKPIFKFVDLFGEFLFLCIQFVLSSKDELVKYDSDNFPLFDSTERI